MNSRELQEEFYELYKMEKITKERQEIIKKFVHDELSDYDQKRFEIEDLIIKYSLRKKIDWDYEAIYDELTSYFNMETLVRNNVVTLREAVLNREQRNSVFNFKTETSLRLVPRQGLKDFSKACKYSVPTDVYNLKYAMREYKAIMDDLETLKKEKDNFKKKILTFMGDASSCDFFEFYYKKVKNTKKEINKKEILKLENLEQLCMANPSELKNFALKGYISYSNYEKFGRVTDMTPIMSIVTKETDQKQHEILQKIRKDIRKKAIR